MSTLVLVRHAQSTTFESNSDRLTDAGEQQAVCLGQYWKAQGVQFDEVYTGTMQRHVRTAELAGFRKFTAQAEFNEYDSLGILLANPDFAPAADNRQLQKQFETMMPLWMADKLDASGVESWTAFRDRVRRGLQAIIDPEAPSRRVVVFTSGGPIGVAVQTVLQSPDPIAIEVNWRIKNCSLTEFVFTRGRISLDSFNSTPHLREVTFR
jgi:broad specificity phosphatase PhoE